MVTAGSQRAWSVRRYRAEDAQQLQGLYERVTQPYRPEDAAEVRAMHEPARIARLEGLGVTGIISNDPRLFVSG